MLVTAVLLHLNWTITCLVVKEKDKIKEPGRNIGYRALKTAEI